MNFEAALDFARGKHRGQYRKQGADYIVHPIRVTELLKAKGISRMELLIAGLFHDLLEDTDTREEEIVAYGNDLVLRIVKDLTKVKDENFSMEAYIGNIRRHEDSTLVKLADRISNLEDSFGLKDRAFLNRYIGDTEDYFVDLAQGTVFEEDLDRVLAELKAYTEGISSE